MPDEIVTWEKKLGQLLEIGKRLEGLESQVSAEVRSKLVEIKQLVAEVAETEPGTRNIGPGRNR